MKNDQSPIEQAAEDLQTIENLLEQATEEATSRALERSADLIRREIKNAVGEI